MGDYSTVAILGAGISGLSAARALRKSGVDVTVYERNDQPGGVIHTHRENGWLVEHGPHTMLVRHQKIWDLLDELGLNNDIQKPRSEAKKRYIVRDGRPVAVPMGFTDFLTTDLLSFPAKLRLLKEPFIETPMKNDESIADFIRRRLGSEPLDYGVDPFVSGVYAGDPARLSVKHTFGSFFELVQTHGSIAKGYIKKEKDSASADRALISFDEGLQVLPQTIAARLGESLHLNSEIQKISKTNEGWNLQFQTDETRYHEFIISTIPAYLLPEILDSWNGEEQGKLTEINYAPMSVLGLGFRRDQIGHPLDGFGILVPEKEPFSMLGCLFSSSLFEHRAPKNHALLTCFAGGARHPAMAALSTDELVNKIMPQLQKLLGVQGDPVFRHHQYWPQAIPQYEVGYDRYLQAMNKIEAEHPKLHLAGNYRGGVSVPNCIINGIETAEDIATR